MLDLVLYKQQYLQEMEQYNNQDYQSQDNTAYQNQQQIPQTEQKQAGFPLPDVLQQTMDNIDLSKTTKRGRTSQGTAGKSEIERIATNAANTVVREVSRQIVRGIFGQLKRK